MTKISCKLQWKLCRETVRTIIQCGGSIFGGAVRDMILHDHHATEFYTRVPGLAAEASYEDPTCHSDLSGRYVVPNDIDATIPEAELPALLNAWKKKGFQARRVFERDAKSYLPNLTCSVGEVRHAHYVLHTMTASIANAIKHSIWSQIALFIQGEVCGAVDNLINALNTLADSAPRVHVDLMIVKTDASCEAPFGLPDFECNALLFDSTGVRIAKGLIQADAMPFTSYNHLQKIIRDIVHWRAVPVQGIVPIEPRLRKMAKRKWQIELAHIQRDKLHNDELCFICHDGFEKEHLKMTCCSGRMHKDCFLQACTKGPAAMADTDRCIYCRQEFYSILQGATIQDDARVVRAELDLPPVIAAEEELATSADAPEVPPTESTQSSP